MAASLEELKKIYKVGDRIALDEMLGDPRPVPAGTQGTIRGFDSMNVLVNWDNGSRLSIIPEIDKFHKI